MAEQLKHVRCLASAPSCRQVQARQQNKHAALLTSADLQPAASAVRQLKCTALAQPCSATPPTPTPHSRPPAAAPPQPCRSAAQSPPARPCWPAACRSRCGGAKLVVRAISGMEVKQCLQCSRHISTQHVIAHPCKYKCSPASVTPYLDSPQHNEHSPHVVLQPLVGVGVIVHQVALVTLNHHARIGGADAPRANDAHSLVLRCRSRRGSGEVQEGARGGPVQPTVCQVERQEGPTLPACAAAARLAAPHRCWPARSAPPLATPAPTCSRLPTNRVGSQPL